MAPIDSAPATKPEPTLTAATQKNVQGSSPVEAVMARCELGAEAKLVKSKPSWETREKSKSEQGDWRAYVD